MKVSLLLSIHNRSLLFSLGLRTLVKQDFPANEWELIVIDDMSTEDLKPVFEQYIGKLNIRHMRIDHTRHEIFKELNPKWKPGQDNPPVWWHTPALSINLGIKKAAGEILWITQPEVLQAPQNLKMGYEMASGATRFAFVDVWNDVRGIVKGEVMNNGLFERQGVHDMVHNYSNMMRRESPAMYWFSAFCSREKAIQINGVRELYLRGAAAEDDDFRERLNMADCNPYLLPRPAVGLHLFHEDETEFHHRRDHDHWNKGLEHNRGWYGMWKCRGDRKAKATEQEGKWGDESCIDYIKEYLL